MTSTGRGRHAHLWVGTDGTGLHAPLGELVRDEDSGRVCCHLCGRWFVLLGAHVRVHGHTGDSYREAVGLCRSRALAAAPLSTSLSTRLRTQYEGQPAARHRLVPGQELARSGELAARARRARRPEPLERVRVQAEQLDAGRRTQLLRHDSRVEQRVAALGADDLRGYLRQAYAQGASLQDLGRVTGLGRVRLRQALVDAGVTVRPTGSTTPAGRRSRAVTADADAASRLGVTDLDAWLRERRAEGWSLPRLAVAVGHSSPWVRLRLAREACAPGSVATGSTASG